MPSWLRATLPVFGALLVGAAYPLGLAPWNWWSIGILSVAALAALTYQSSLRQLATRTFAYGLGLFGAGSSWVYYSIHDYGYAPVPLALLLTGLFTLLLAAVFVLPFLLLKPLSRRTPLPWLVAFSALWVLGEYLRSWLFTGFPWLFLGYGHLDSPLAGWAPLGGVYAISFFATLTAALFGLARAWKAHLEQAFTAIAVLVVCWLGGGLLSTVEFTQPTGEPVTVSLIQPNLSLETKWDAQLIQDILGRLSEQSEPHWGQQLVIWPESAVPDFAHRVAPFLQAIDQQARRHGTTLITGIPTAQPAGIYHNSLLALGSGSGQYDKHHLVPFGEYVPLEQWLRGLIRFFDLPMSQFTAGPRGQPHLQAGDLQIGSAICYEVAYSSLVAEQGRRSHFLVTVSNDAWFGDSIGPLQHLQIVQMRALENGRWFARATNNGVTALIDHRGRIVDSLPQFTEDELRGTLIPRTGTTPFQVLSTGWFLLFYASVYAIALVARPQHQS